MAELALTASTGRTQGTRPSRRLRREGLVPGVVYGLGVEPVVVSVEYSDLRTTLTTDAGLNALIDLKVDGDTQLCIVKDLQRDAIGSHVIHVDFIRIDAAAEIEVEVPIVLEGEARKVLDEDGMVDQALHSITVLSKPDAIPNEITIDISALTVGDAIRIADVALPAGVRTEMDGDEAVAMGTVTRSTLEAMAEDEAAEAAAELEAEEGPEGEAADDDSGDEAADTE